MDNIKLPQLKHKIYFMIYLVMAIYIALYCAHRSSIFLKHFITCNLARSHIRLVYIILGLTSTYNLIQKFNNQIIVTKIVFI